MRRLILLQISLSIIILFFLFFFFNDTAPTEIYTLSLHDALPILSLAVECGCSLPSTWTSMFLAFFWISVWVASTCSTSDVDRKSTRLNSSHVSISYAVFCLKKKKKKKTENQTQLSDATSIGEVCL